MYADDANGQLKDKQSAKCLLKLADRFGRASGLKPNKEKTEAMWQGSMKDSNEKPLGISWPDGPLRILGILVSYNKNYVYNYNFRRCIDRLKRVLMLWRNRDLTLQGSATIVKSLV
jgi:hypothetical protein